MHVIEFTIQNDCMFKVTINYDRNPGHEIETPRGRVWEGPPPQLTRESKGAS